MSWALLHDKDNWLRNGRATVSSFPPALPGYSVDALRDGAQAIPFATPGNAGDLIRISVSGAPSLCFFAVHDFRFSEAEPPTVRLDVDGAVVKVFDPEEILRGELYWIGLVSEVSSVELRVMASDRWSAGEITLGQDIQVGSKGCAPDVQRSSTRGGHWNTVANGPWRSKLSEPVRSYVLSFAPTTFERTMEVYSDAVGGLRPVSLVPWVGDYEVIHGHLEDDYTATEGLGGVWEEGMSLNFRESMRALK